MAIGGPGSGRPSKANASHGALRAQGHQNLTLTGTERKDARFIRWINEYTREAQHNLAIELYPLNVISTGIIH